MPCFYPIPAYRIADKEGRDFGVVFSTRSGMNVTQELKIPCGNCIGCKLERARQWAVRCMHEASLYERNCFITLTYDDDHLPDGNSLDYADFQKFMKRLRKKFTGRKVRFFMCGEYGDKLKRPHFHACLFNIDFDDRVHFKTGPSGHKVYTSETLKSLWLDRRGNPIGFTTVGDVSIDSAGYVARYVVKKKLGRGSDTDYEEINLETGEVYKREKEFNRMSLKPGIGAGFYEKYRRDMFPHDICVVNGKETKPPKYYYKKLLLDDGFQHDEIAYIRECRARKSAEDNTPERLEVKERVLNARIQFLKRELS